MSRIMPISSLNTCCGRRNAGNVGAHEPAGLAVLLENRDLVAERHEIVGDGERGAARANAGDALAVLQTRDLRQQPRNIVAVIGRDALQAADGDRLLLDATAAAGRLAGPVADPAEDAGKNVGVAVHHIGFGEPSLGDQSNVFRDIGVGRASPLAIHDLVIVVGMRGICGVHSMPRAVAGLL